MSEVEVLLFASYRELVGEDRVSISIESTMTVDALIAQLRSRGGAWGRLPEHLTVAVNQRYVRGDHRLGAFDQVALIPPVAGG